MFDNVLKELRKLKQTKTYSVPLLADKDGYTDRECAAENCLFQFKVHQEDWKNIFKDDKVFCPMCRHQAHSQSWWTTEQINQGKEQIKKKIVGQLNNAFHSDAEDFNSRQPPNSFLSIKMSFTGNRSPAYLLPIPTKEEMELKIKCKECNARYSVIGSAFFCPCCGHNSAEETFDNSIKKIEAKIYNLETIKKALQSISKDDAVVACRSLIETSLNDCVVAFQRFCEVSFKKRFPTVKVSFNAFQKLDAGSDYWQKELGEGYLDWLPAFELAELKILFQKRHLLSHTEGVVDQRYIDNSNDNAYNVEQRITVKEDDVLRCVALIQNLVTTIKSKI